MNASTSQNFTTIQPINISKENYCFKGDGSSIITTNFSSYFKKNSKNLNNQQKKMIATFVEMVNQISTYSQKKDIMLTGDEFQILQQENKTSFIILASLKIKNSYLKEIISLCQSINRLDFEHLRSLKRYEMKQSIYTLQNCKNSDCVKAAFKSSFPIDFENLIINKDFSIIRLTTKI